MQQFYQKNDYYKVEGRKQTLKEEQLCSLLSSMSLKEKIGQLIQLSGDFFSTANLSIGPIKKLGISPEFVKLAGSTLNVVGFENIKRVQDKQMEVQPHHIPMLFMSDVIYGYKTIFPIPLGFSSSWNPDLVEKAFECAADEASASGVQVAFAPMIDVVRDARWGRVLESLGEDPFLTSIFAKSMVEGLQKNLPCKKGLVACFKHFAAYGAVEGGREYNSVDLSLSNLFQNYLPPYKAAVESGAKMAMTSLTTLNGVPSTADKWLLTDILRKKWGFNGVIISDYASIQEIIKHGFAEDNEDAAFKSLSAGVDIDMKSPVYASGLEKLITNRKLDIKKVDSAVFRVLRLKNDLGLFENPYFGASTTREKTSLLTPQKRELSRSLAEESMVLLKNENNALPLNNKEKMVLIGPYADNHALNGMWAIHSSKKDTISIHQGIKRFVADIPTEKGTDLRRDSKFLENLGFLSEQEIKNMVSSEEENRNNLMKAIKISQKADTIILALGEETYEAGEAGSKTKLELPKNQIHLIDELSKLRKKIILIIIAGRPLALENIIDKVDAILYCWFPGSEGGNAIANILFGFKNPSGRLTMSYPRVSAQEPLYYNHLSTGRPQNSSKGRFVSKYIDSPADPLYPFGYGLSYGFVNYTELKTDKYVFTKDSTINVTVKLKNSSDFDTTEVVQLYIHDKVAEVVQPVQRLIDFKKVKLKRGQELTIHFNISSSQLTFFDNRGNEKLEPGVFDIICGTNGKQLLTTTIRLK
ncbi:beta-glucosidase BglX [Ligilactobacillus agilis]|uniref:beta-glucosidase BglX n=1 Tax=Ligilactobacillus agilis TaxID=1601 RepID=UPI00280AFB05|nr:beta-glucosidase BglX [Ligilactobacillus agilis]